MQDYMQKEVKTNRRHLFGFANGIYNAMSDRFHDFSDEPDHACPHSACEESVGRFDRYTPLAQHFGASEQMKFNNEHWSRIRDPVLDPIIAYQNLSDEQEWHLWASIGRLLYDNNTTDAWERTLVVSGRSPCGLGVLTRRIASIYPRDRIAVPVLFQSADACAIVSQTAYLGILDENSVRHLDESCFARMTSGESLHDLAGTEVTIKSTLGFGSSSALCASRLSVASASKLDSFEDEVKAATSSPFLPSPWRAPLLIASHTLPDWMHPEKECSSWRIVRRLTYVPFKHRVETKDINPLLLRAAINNVAIGNFLMKANRAYRQLLKCAAKRSTYSAVGTRESEQSKVSEPICASEGVCPIPYLVDSARKLTRLRRLHCSVAETTDDNDVSDSDST